MTGLGARGGFRAVLSGLKLPEGVGGWRRDSGDPTRGLTGSLQPSVEEWRKFQGPISTDKEVR